jgi:hypothetical protein
MFVGCPLWVGIVQSVKYLKFFKLIFITENQWVSHYVTLVWRNSLDLIIISITKLKPMVLLLAKIDQLENWTTWKKKKREFKIKKNQQLFVGSSLN